MSVSTSLSTSLSTSYPYLSDLVRALTGYDLPLPFAMFGIFVALGVLAAAQCMKAEVRRLFDSGRIRSARRKVRQEDGSSVEMNVSPAELITDLAFTVTIAGIVGARLFHILEHTDQFMLDPWGMIFSRSGLSIFGGLIVGTIAGLICVRRWKLPGRPLMDAIAPALMLGYGIGRIGCQVSGDGDWGIAADMALKPDWLPTWWWAQTYENNIYGEVIALPGVYPTPVYETIMALFCFAVLWALRKHPFQSGWLFSVYLILAGAERLLIEQIRVNPPYHFMGYQATQAEIIAVTLMVLGAIGVALLSRLPQRYTLGASSTVDRV